MKKRFINQKIKKLNVSGFIDQKTSPKELELESFFLSLALIFNDIKGLTILEKNLVDSYELPVSSEVSDHAGEWAGIKSQLFKYFVSTLYEFLELIKSKKNLISSSSFKKYYYQLNNSDQNIWSLILNISGADNSVNYNRDEVKLFEELLKLVRNEISFHYDASGKPLLSGFRTFFYSTNENPGKKYVMYSATKTDFYGTRFYYADAALNGCLSNEFSKVNKTEKVVAETIYKTSMRVAKVIMGLLEAYHKNKKKA